MPYPPQVFSLDGHAFGLTVSGVQVITKVPTDLYPLRWEMPSEAQNGGISFTILDEGETSLLPGHVVRLTDNVNNELLASGVLVNRRFARHGGPYRRVECEAVGWGWWLDNRIVTEYAWAAPGPEYDGQWTLWRAVREFGGPLSSITADTALVAPIAAAGTATRTSLRSTLSSIVDDITDSENLWHVYVNDDAQVRWWWGTGGDTALGTATTSIGDQGDYIPESLTYEVGSESRANLVAAYSTAPAFVGWRWVGGWTSAYAVSSWEAGDPTTYWVDDIGYGNPDDAAQYAAWQVHGDITSVSFTTTEYGGWKPHQAIVIDDSMLTGGTAVTQYVASVSGSIDHRNVIEWRVQTGAISRSIVQTVATP